MLGIVALAFCLVDSAMAGWVTSGNNMYSDVSGNVGIGTSSPTAKLEVNGNIAFTNWGNWIGADPELIRLQMDVGMWTFYTGVNVAAMRIDNVGNVGIGTTTPAAKLDVRGDILWGEGGYLSTDQGSSIELRGDGKSPFIDFANDLASDNDFRIIEQSDGSCLRMGPGPGSLFLTSDGKVGVGTSTPDLPFEVSEGTNATQVGGGWMELLNSNGAGIDWKRSNNEDYDFRFIEATDGSYLSMGPYDRSSLILYSDGLVEIWGNVRILSRTTGEQVIALGEGLDYAEGFSVSDREKVGPGTVLVIDAKNPGQLAVSGTPYDTRVAGIVAGAKGQGSGVRLGSGEFDHDVALAGRVYCNVDATDAAVSPGDLLTTSGTPGYAMKAMDYRRAQGAILGKAMESMDKGNKGQILVLVTLQ